MLSVFGDMKGDITWFGLVSLFNGISTLFRLFNAKAILREEQYWCYLTHSWQDKGVHTFPKGICPKVNVIARLEYEFAYYDSAVHRFNHYTTRTPHITWKRYTCKQCFQADPFGILFYYLLDEPSMIWLVGWLVGFYGILTFQNFIDFKYGTWYLLA